MRYFFQPFDSATVFEVLLNDSEGGVDNDHGRDILKNALFYLEQPKSFQWMKDMRSRSTVEEYLKAVGDESL